MTLAGRRRMFRRRYKGVQLAVERRAFERKLERIIRTANAHSSCGLAGGATEYKLLRKQACELCEEFAQRWTIPPELLQAQVPALGRLKSLADPAAENKPEILISLGIAGAMLLFFLTGVLAGLANIGYHLIGGR